MNVHKLVEQYIQATKKISSPDEVVRHRKDYIQKVSRLTGVEEEIHNALQSLIEKPCKETANLWLIAARVHPTKKYSESLFILLQKPEFCIWREGILYIFEAIPDKRMIPYLEIAIERELPDDPGKALAILAMEILIAIDTDEAWSVIERAAKTSSSNIIKEETEAFIDEYRNK